MKSDNRTAQCACVNGSFAALPPELRPRPKKKSSLRKVTCPGCGLVYSTNRPTDLCMDCEAKSESGGKVIIVPCSGIGKTYGTVSREAAYEVTEDMRPAETQLVALSLLVLGDEAIRAAVGRGPTVTIDGCKLACATKVVEESGGAIVRDFAVLDVYRRHRQFKPQGIAELNEGGRELAHVLAEEIVAVVDNLSKSRSRTG